MPSTFRQAIEDPRRIILFDGAMGTELAARGVEPGSTPDPDVLENIHDDYRKAGADVLTTNTFDANALVLDIGNIIPDALKEQFRSACEVARKVAAEDGFVAGDMGPMRLLLEPYGTVQERDMRSAFTTSAKFLADCGVDLFIVETMTDAREMRLAVEACRKAASDIVVAASMAFDPSKQGGFRTNMGVSPSEAAQAMVAAGADIIGANCGSVTPVQMAEIVREFRSVTTQHPILIQPNAGVPELQAGQTVFRLAPEAFADGMLEVIAAGAQLVGGCCGTTPEHIRRLRQALQRK